MSLINKKFNLGVGEEIVDIIRSTPLFIWCKYFFGLLILGVTSFFLFWLLTKEIWGYVAIGLSYMIGLVIIFRTWFFYHFNCLVVTTEKIVDIDRPKIFEETISTVNYLDIQDIYVIKKGFLQNVLNYGSVMVETKKQQFILEIKKVRLPQRLANWLLEVKDNYYKKQKLTDRQAVMNDFLQIMPKLSPEDLQTVYLKVAEQIKKNNNQESE
ncbi:MAG: hypothetical protein COU29_04400 [Candidatus Magasanikbacteria bacterium CG10_big_fil_rev_8_21_14_0_10_36_32]|uniref:DUF304 domain-containing protein n=1 Tax=Candidatus Magasanikbacteria bacterium CG10_big_fil_rev_8_21_14_0_10_36_32 TaxID=1974646 RepID=A0A2M6W5D0_9BACT|nr:MAG: hypothetical protein COU29_04400 [Candidatus Magasanikbacteria bacterium CG10_big_fil_rev_8_21_14_0_10_36_32]